MQLNLISKSAIKRNERKAKWNEFATSNEKKNPKFQNSRPHRHRRRHRKIEMDSRFKCIWKTEVKPLIQFNLSQWSEHEKRRQFSKIIFYMNNNMNNNMEDDGIEWYGLFNFGIFFKKIEFHWFHSLQFLL